jgi:hypothetical protein
VRFLPCGRLLGGCSNPCLLSVGRLDSPRFSGWIASARPDSPVRLLPFGRVLDGGFSAPELSGEISALRPSSRWVLKPVPALRGSSRLASVLRVDCVSPSQLAVELPPYGRLSAASLGLPRHSARPPPFGWFLGGSSRLASTCPARPDSPRLSGEAAACWPLPRWITLACLSPPGCRARSFSPLQNINLAAAILAQSIE